MKITVTGKETKTVSCRQGQSVLEALTENGIFISAFCGGSGRCGKCKIQLTEGTVSPSPEDRAFFTEEELEQGFRLACTARPGEDCTVRVFGPDEEKFDVLGADGEGAEKDARPENAGRYQFAIDIGTTTLAISLVAEDAGGQRGRISMADTYTGVNHQRAYGADVISRIHAFDEGKGEAMTDSVRRDLLAGMEQLMKKHGIDGSRITKVLIAGNTTMGHLLLGYDCHGLGQVPFHPVNLNPVRLPFSHVFHSDLTEAEVTVLPGFSTFVGGDIVSGLFCCGFYQAGRPSLFIDLGTNGEMAVGNRDRLLVTSTAAGPAFEGGNISWGTGSVGGAIYGVQIRQGKAFTETVGQLPPVGICGTGVIEATAELLKEELLDETGLLDEEYFEEGFPLGETPDGQRITYTQKDIRELQLAKAAVRAGLETLLLRYGIGYEDLEHVYVAGGFGVHLNMEKAVAIGLFPEELLKKIRAAGNTSLKGAALYGQEPEAERICMEMIGKAEEIDLSTDEDFQNYYMDSMYFE